MNCSASFSGIFNPRFMPTNHAHDFFMNLKE